MWNPWDLTFGQAASIIFVIVGFGYLLGLLLDELRRIRIALEAIRYRMEARPPSPDPFLYSEPDEV